MEDQTDDTGNKTHNKELGSDLRNVVALGYYAPDGPDHADQDGQQHQLMSKCKRNICLAVLLKVLSVFLIRLICNGELRIFFHLCRVTHGEHTGKCSEDDP